MAFVAGQLRRSEQKRSKRGKGGRHRLRFSSAHHRRHGKGIRGQVPGGGQRPFERRPAEIEGSVALPHLGGVGDALLPPHAPVVLPSRRRVGGVGEAKALIGSPERRGFGQNQAAIWAHPQKGPVRRRPHHPQFVAVRRRPRCAPRLLRGTLRPHIVRGRIVVVPSIAHDFFQLVGNPKQPKRVGAARRAGYLRRNEPASTIAIRSQHHPIGGAELDGPVPAFRDQPSIRRPVIHSRGFSRRRHEKDR
mmetsp:Transcript_6909/g.16927  ORF Transcript_6909/g.16927 Transcript_6909/m.16927 type:complete len:248 (-) Transcript_6909:571-1314(-)